jgi:hypothetical protein
MTKPANIAGIEKATNISWDDWLKFLDSKNAKNLSHKEIAEHVYSKLEKQLENAGWWSQSVTVAYEQHIGRRQPGQRSDGSFEVAISKRFTGDIDEVFSAWLSFIKDRTSFDENPITNEPTMTKTDINRHWAVNLADGTRVSVDVNSYSPPKTNLTITHAKLKDHESLEKWRSFWKQFLNDLSVSN